MSTQLRAQIFRAIRLFTVTFLAILEAFLNGSNPVTVAGVAGVAVAAAEVTLRSVRPTEASK